jgi:dTDP-4-amino-4,6-dideoxygalactose transaminase
LTALRAEGIPCASGSCSEVYLEKAFEHLNLRPPQRLPNARQLGETSIMLPVHPTLGSKDMQDMVAAFDVVMGEAGMDR